MLAMKTTVIIPGVVGHFFCGAAAAIYGNSEGGKRGAVLGATVNGLLISWLPLLILPVLGTLKIAASTFADTDYLVPGILLGNLGSVGTLAIVIGIIGFFVAVVATSMILNEKDKKKLMD
jgi:PTS system ascorbate-specific IIC component